jgi:hypothetical protein
LFLGTAGGQVQLIPALFFQVAFAAGDDYLVRRGGIAPAQNLRFLLFELLVDGEEVKSSLAAASRGRRGL